MTVAFSILAVTLLLTIFVAVHLSNFALWQAKHAESANPFSVPDPIVIYRQLSMKRYRAEVEAIAEPGYNEGPPDEYIERRLAENMFRDLPLSELRALLNMEKISPYEQIDGDTPFDRVMEIRDCQRRRRTKYRAELKAYIETIT